MKNEGEGDERDTVNVLLMELFKQDELKMRATVDSQFS